MASNLEEPLASRRRRLSALTLPGFSRPVSSYCLSPGFLPPSTTKYTNYTLQYTTPASTHFHARLKGERAGSGGRAAGSMVGEVVLTRMLLEQLGTFEAKVVIPYLRGELEWFIENDDELQLELSEVKGLMVKLACAEVKLFGGAKPKRVYYESVIDGKRGGIK